MASTPPTPWTELLGNHRYRGGAFGWIFLVLMGGINLFRGSVHLFAGDGGASRIAGAAALWASLRSREEAGSWLLRPRSVR